MTGLFEAFQALQRAQDALAKTPGAVGAADEAVKAGAAFQDALHEASTAIQQLEDAHDALDNLHMRHSEPGRGFPRKDEHGTYTVAGRIERLHQCFKLVDKRGLRE